MLKAESFLPHPLANKSRPVSSIAPPTLEPSPVAALSRETSILAATPRSRCPRNTQPRPLAQSHDVHWDRILSQPIRFAARPALQARPKAAAESAQTLS